MYYNGEFDLLDSLTVVSFMIGLLNYEENLGQSQMQDMLNDVINTINNHLVLQDKKIDRILELLEVEKQDGT